MDMNYRGECGGERMCRMEWSEGGGEWDNCNSIIINILKKIMLTPGSWDIGTILVAGYCKW